MGGGLAGLVAALHLAERGLRPLVLEAHPTRLGGRWRADDGEADVTLTDAQGGVWRFPSEHGLHGLWGQYHNVRATFERFAPEILPRLVSAERQEWVYADAGSRARRVELGRVVTRTRLPAPFHYLALFVRPSFLALMTPLEVASLPWVFASLQMALLFDPLVRPDDAEALARTRLRSFFLGWSPRLRAMVAALARSGLFADPDVAPLAGFIAFLRFYTLLRRDAQRFQYLPDNPQEVVFAPLRAALEARGGAVQLGARVQHLSTTSDGAWHIAWDDGNGTRDAIQAASVVVAADAPATRDLFLRSEPTRRVAEARVDWPAGVANAAARLWWDRQPTSGRYAEAAILGGDFTGDNCFWLPRILRESPFAEWAAETGGSACEVHVYGPDDVLEQPDAAILARVVLDIRRAYPALREARLLAATLRRNPPTHTLFNIGATARHLEVETPWPNLWLCGDWLRYPSPTLFLERAAVTGLAAANGVLSGLSLQPFAILPPDPPEPLARALGAMWRVLHRR